MTRSRSDLLWGAGLLLLAVVLLGQLVAGDAEGAFQVVARVLRLVLVLALAALFLTTRDLAALAVAASAVVLLLVTLTVGLLAAPTQFVGTGPKAPGDADEARALGLVLTTLLVLAASFVMRRRWLVRRSAGQASEDGLHGR